MAQYQEFEIRKDADPADFCQRIAGFLAGAYSVELVNKEGEKLLLRVWLERHCDPGTHEKI